MTLSGGGAGGAGCRVPELDRRAVICSRSGKFLQMAVQSSKLVRERSLSLWRCRACQCRTGRWALL